MTNEHELNRRLTEAAAAIDAEPDLDTVIGRSLQKRTRSRQVAVLSAAAVAMLGVGALAWAANREPRATSDRPPLVATTPPPSEAEVTDDTDVNAPSTVLDVPATAPSRPATSDSTTPTDPADPYLDRTTVVFDGVMNDDLRFVVRLSDVTYGELFDIEWTAPTGSTEECLSGPAIITGNPDGLRDDANETSSWDASPLVPLSDARPTDVAMAAGPFSFRIEPDADTSVFVVRTQLPVSEVVVQGEGITSNSIGFVDGVAVIEVVSELVPVEPESSTRTVLFDQATLTMRPEMGSEIDAALLTLPLVTSDGLDLVPTSCLPPGPPPVELPPPGEQPGNPASAEAIIRDRFALAVDPTIPFSDKPDGLFDSAAGLEQAIDEALGGPNAEYVRNARYEIVDVVFTSPGEAWFLYDLDALGVSYRPFGRALLDGESWQISRNTICQDLARTGVLCEPAASTETPTNDETNAPTTMLSEQQQQAYSESLNCNPIRPCEDR